MYIHTHEITNLNGGTGGSLPGTGGRFDDACHLFGIGNVSLLLHISGEEGCPSGRGTWGRVECSRPLVTGLGTNLSPAVGQISEGKIQAHQTDYAYS